MINGQFSIFNGQFSMINCQFSIGIKQRWWVGC